MEFKELSIEEMVRGYTENPVTGSLRCVFCCEVFERGLIYTSRGRTVTAERAAEEHMLDEHDGAFYGMLRLGKAIHGRRTTVSWAKKWGSAPQPYGHTNSISSG